MTRPAPRIHLSLNPDPAARATAEAIDHADANARADAGWRLQQARNARRWPSGWWIAPSALIGAGILGAALVGWVM